MTGDGLTGHVAMMQISNLGIIALPVNNLRLYCQLPRSFQDISRGRPRSLTICRLDALRMNNSYQWPRGLIEKRYRFPESGIAGSSLVIVRNLSPPLSFTRSPVSLSRDVSAL